MKTDLKEDELMDSCNGYYENLIKNFDESNFEEGKKSVIAFIQFFETSIKDGVMQKIEDKKGFSDIEKRALNCLCVSINIINSIKVGIGNEHVEKLIDYMKNFSPHSETSLICRRMTEMILYCLCNCCSRTIDQGKQLIDLQEADKHTLKRCMEYKDLRKIQISAAVVVCFLAFTDVELITLAKKNLKNLEEHFLQYIGITRQLINLAIHGVGMEKYNEMARALAHSEKKIQLMSQQIKNLEDNENSVRYQKEESVCPDTKFESEKQSPTLMVKKYVERTQPLEIIRTGDSDIYEAVTLADFNYFRSFDNVKENKEHKPFKLNLPQLFLHKSIEEDDLDSFNKLCSIDNVNDRDEDKRKSVLETAAEHGHHYFFKKVLKKTVFDKEVWEKARQDAKKNGHDKIVEVLDERENLLDSRIKRNFSLLHTAVLENRQRMVEYILKAKFVDKDINHKTFGTALALAHSLGHRKCVTVLEKFGVDVNTANQYGQTPLHEAIASGTHDECQYFLDNCHDINRKGFENLTSLHCAVVAGLEDLCEKLVKAGVVWTEVVNLSNQSSNTETRELSIMSLTSCENALTLCLKYNKTIYPCLRKLDEEISNFCDGSNNSLLHLAAAALQPDICELILENGASVNVKNDAGNTCLSELFLTRRSSPSKVCCSSKSTSDGDMKSLFDVAKILVEHEADVNSTNKDGESVIECAAKFKDEKLMFSLISRSNQMRITKEIFDLVFKNQWFEFGKMLLEMASVSEISPLITESEFELSLKNENVEFIKCLFAKADETVQLNVAEDILWNAAIKDRTELFNYFIHKEIKEPKLKTGDNLLTYLLRSKKSQFCWQLLNSNNKHKYANSKNCQRQLPLQVAVEMDELELADNVLSYTDYVNNEDTRGETVLSQLFRKISTCAQGDKETLFELVDLVIQKGGDIYKSTSKYAQVLNACSTVTIKNQVKAIYRCSTGKSDKGTDTSAMEK